MWAREVVPRVGIAGFAVGAIVVERMTPQIINTSNGVITSISPSQTRAIIKSSLAKQTGLIALQFATAREIKLALDSIQASPALSLLLAFGITGVPCASLSYNWAIQDTYRHLGIMPPRYAGITGFLKLKVAPGLVWSFLRAGCGTGGALYIGPIAASKLKSCFRWLSPTYTPPESLVKFTAGLATGGITSLATQGVHNVTLVASRMAALGTTIQSPHYTTVALWTTWREMGFRALYLNYPQRVAISAVTAAVLNACDIFHNPEVSGWS
jgi:hypothetical protein